MSFELLVSLRYLRAKRKHGFISVNTVISIAGVMLGVMAMMVVLAVMTGFGTDIKSKILGMNAHIRIMGRAGSITGHEAVLKKIEAVDHVIAATPFVHAQIMLRSGSRASGAILKGVDPLQAGQVLDFRKSTLPNGFKVLAEQGPAKNADQAHSAPGVILGKELAKTLGVDQGDALFAVSALGTSLTPFGTRVPHMKRLTVVGVFDSGMYDYDSSFAFVSIASAQKLLRLDGSSVHGIEVKIEDIYRANEISKSILTELGPGYWAQDWMEMNKNFFSALKLEKVVMFIILVLIVLVAAFNIISTLIMMVMEKRKDIAILKSMGATAKNIMKIFMMEGLIIGLIGTLLGLIGGGVICFLLQRYEFIKLPSDVYYISTLPVEVQPLDVILVALSAVVVSFLATLYPSYRASRLEPVSAIRYE